MAAEFTATGITIYKRSSKFTDVFVQHFAYDRRLMSPSSIASVKILKEPATSSPVSVIGCFKRFVVFLLIPPGINELPQQ
jgi:hypothetical protein